jgi:hypothetical protein
MFLRTFICIAAVATLGAHAYTVYIVGGEEIYEAAIPSHLQAGYYAGTLPPIMYGALPRKVHTLLFCLSHDMLQASTKVTIFDVATNTFTAAAPLPVPMAG